MISTPPGFRALVSPLPSGTPNTFVFRGNELLLREDLSLPDANAIDTLALDAERVVPVGALDHEYYRTAWMDRGHDPGPGFAFKGLRALFGKLDESTLAIAGRAFQVADWARTHRFCGSCAKLMARMQGERAMRCECGHSAYPRISPAMMVLVKRGPEILLARNVAVPAGGRMSALAGFLEPGESIEDAVHREVLEEVGLEVRDLRYFASQSWPFPHALMVAFTAEYAGGEVRCEPAEIAEARWFGPGDPLPELSPGQSISRALINANLPRG